ncbi:MAG: DUF6531 domain-containing protein [Acidobacteriota bacterium]
MGDLSQKNPASGRSHRPGILHFLLATAVAFAGPATFAQLHEFQLCSAGTLPGSSQCQDPTSPTESGGDGNGGTDPAADPVSSFIRSLDQEPFLNPDVGTFGVSLASGEYISQVTDLSIPGRGIDFTFTRTYRSRNRNETALGRAWNFNYNERLVPHWDPDSGDRWLEWIRGDSWSAVLRWDPTRGYVGFSGFTGLARERVSESWPRAARYAMRRPDGMIHYFGADSFLAAIVDRNGNTLEFFRDADGRLSYVLDTMGRRIDFTDTTPPGGSHPFRTLPGGAWSMPTTATVISSRCARRW